MENIVLTEKDSNLFKGVNTANPPHHDKLVPGWAPPAPPQGYRNLVAILVPVSLEDGSKSRSWELDYLDTATGVFASEDHDFEVLWPWIAGYRPNPQDWDAIGIPYLT